MKPTYSFKEFSLAYVYGIFGIIFWLLYLFKKGEFVGISYAGWGMISLLYSLILFHDKRLDILEKSK